MNLSKYALLVGFLLIIFGLGFLNLIDADNDASFYENRPLAQKPVPSLQSYKSGDYFTQYDSYYTDQFIARQKWIWAYNKWNYLLPIPYKKSFYVQKDNTIIEEPLVKQPPEFFKPYTYQVNGLAKATKEQNIPFYFFLAPAKNQMLSPLLPSYMPDGGNLENEKNFLAQLDKSVVKVDDISSWFKKHYTATEAKKIFFKSDHHWNMEGAYQGYKLVINRLRKDFPEIKQPFNKEDLTKTCAVADKLYGSDAFQLAMVVDTTGDIPCHYTPKDFDFKSLKVYEGPVKKENKKDPLKVYGTNMDVKGEYIKYGEAYTWDYPELNVINNQSTNQLHMLVLKDSYFNPIVYHVASHVHQLSVLDMRYYDPNKLQDYIKNNGIDIVMVFHNETDLSAETYRYGIK